MKSLTWKCLKLHIEDTHLNFGFSSAGKNGEIRKKKFILNSRASFCLKWHVRRIKNETSFLKKIYNYNSYRSKTTDELITGSNNLENLNKLWNQWSQFSCSKTIFSLWLDPRSIWHKQDKALWPTSSHSNQILVPPCTQWDPAWWGGTGFTAWGIGY